ILMGPNTGLGHTSVIYMMEAQIEHLLDALGEMRRRGAAALEPKAEAQAAYLAEIERRMKGTVWTAGGCASWYLDSTGRNSTLWPDFTWRFRRRVARLRADEYVFSLPRGEGEPNGHSAVRSKLLTDASAESRPGGPGSNASNERAAPSVPAETEEAGRV
ncbi:MAG TPA: hypothetical protein VGV38_13595, partial [Pyrinomonadaceae bacterium]|nr:hypothetical protein [Pyrinomonadaceae bacterium]